MADDIVSRLRHGTPSAVYVIAPDAADKIEAQQAEIERLRAELELHRAGTLEVIREEIRSATQRVVAMHNEARRGAD